MYDYVNRIKSPIGIDKILKIQKSTKYKGNNNNFDDELKKRQKELANKNMPEIELVEISKEIAPALRPIQMHVQVKLYKDTQDFLERRPLATKPTTLMKKAIEVYNKSK